MGKTQTIGLVVLIVIIGLALYRGVFQTWIDKKRDKVNDSEKKKV